MEATKKGGGRWRTAVTVVVGGGVVECGRVGEEKSKQGGERRLNGVRRQ